MDLLSKIDKGTLSRLEFTKACDNLKTVKTFDKEHLLLIGALSHFKMNWFIDYFDTIVENLIPCSSVDHYKCLGYLIQYPELWHLVTMHNPSSTFVSKSEQRKQLFNNLLLIPIIDHPNCHFFLSQLVISTKNVNIDLMSNFYLKILNSIPHLDPKAILVVFTRIDFKLSNSATLSIFTSVEQEPFLIPFYIMPAIIKFKEIPSVGPWSTFLSDLYILENEVKSNLSFQKLSLLLENKLILSSILEKSDLLISVQIAMAFDFLDLKMEIEKSTVKSVKDSFTLHPTIQGWTLMTKLVALDVVMLSINDLKVLMSKMKFIFDKSSFSLKALASKCIAAFSMPHFDVINQFMPISELINFSLLICKGNEKYRLGGLRLFYSTINHPDATLNKSQISDFQSIFNKTALSGPFQQRWNACLCIERLRPILSDKIVIVDLTYTLVSALKCKNSKVVVNALGALRYYEYKDKITLSEIEDIVNDLSSKLSTTYKERVHTILSDFQKQKQEQIRFNKYD